MGNILLAVTLILFGITLFSPFLNNIVLAVLFIVTGAVLLFEGRHNLR